VVSDHPGFLLSLGSIPGSGLGAGRLTGCCGQSSASK
jgi:hypothetical protein